ncbi:Uncharacterised protein [Legionella beliardensis]|uniref:Uncharacterized protein n=1 Tax=Legionella beliardensis TaxID=91822 RepID=A0A378JT76_9GAMM|nr:hypothetical protein [Legionella beliardensis]STX55478.1 Uncharacterised protein [Legionella beliardensis]
MNALSPHDDGYVYGAPCHPKEKHVNVGGVRHEYDCDYALVAHAYVHAHDVR